MARFIAGILGIRSYLFLHLGHPKFCDFSLCWLPDFHFWLNDTEKAKEPAFLFHKVNYNKACFTVLSVTKIML